MSGHIARQQSGNAATVATHSARATASDRVFSLTESGISFRAVDLKRLFSRRRIRWHRTPSFKVAQDFSPVRRPRCDRAQSPVPPVAAGVLIACNTVHRIVARAGGGALQEQLALAGVSRERRRTLELRTGLVYASELGARAASCRASGEPRSRPPPSTSPRQSRRSTRLRTAFQRCPSGWRGRSRSRRRSWCPCSG